MVQYVAFYVWFLKPWIYPCHLPLLMKVLRLSGPPKQHVGVTACLPKLFFRNLESAASLQVEAKSSCVCSGLELFRSGWDHSPSHLGTHEHLLLPYWACEACSFAMPTGNNYHLFLSPQASDHPASLFFILTWDSCLQGSRLGACFPVSHHFAANMASLCDFHCIHQQNKPGEMFSPSLGIKF